MKAKNYRIIVKGEENQKRLGGEGEAPAEPHWSINFENGGSPGGSPSQFFHSFPSKGESAPRKK